MGVKTYANWFCETQRKQRDCDSQRSYLVAKAFTTHQGPEDVLYREMLFLNSQTDFFKILSIFPFLGHFSILTLKEWYHLYSSVEENSVYLPLGRQY